jgi:hypothetical protein
MTIVVFTGPTLSASDARARLDAEYLPPAGQGDVYRVARQRPAAIGIVDGFFDTLPAIWHKEILWALHEGIPVFGSASMGALRAAELAAFGMRGVGSVFESFHRGELEDDDEVALAHEPESSGYRALSVPMVNVRATLAAAVAANVVDEEARATLVARMKGLFYPDRSYRRLVAEARAAGRPDAAEALAAWLPSGQVDVKRDDALEMLAAIESHVASGAREPPPRFHFEHTTYWDGLRQSCDERRDAGAVSVSTPQWRDLLDELRLRGGAYETARLRALTHAFGRALAEREGQRIDRDRLTRSVEDFRARHGLFDVASFEAWLVAHDLDATTFARMIEDEAAVRWAWTANDVDRRIADELRLDADYPALRDRALAKRAALAEAGLSEPGPADAEMTRDEVVDWYFAEIARCPRPVDLSRYVHDAGFGDEQLFLRAALRERLYQSLARLAPR